MWYVVRCGVILYVGTEEACAEIIAEDMTGELEMYHEDALVKKMHEERS